MHFLIGMRLRRLLCSVVSAHATSSSPPPRRSSATADGLETRAIDGFMTKQKDAFVGYSSRVAAAVAGGLDRFGRSVGVEVKGLEHLPRGRALLVANHAFGFDIAFAVARIHAVTGRRVWALGEHAWWAVPGVRRLAAAVGTVDGTVENVDALLAADELVLVLPGGLREAVKPRELRYRLLWGHRYGFVRAALRHGAPLVPVVSLGADDLFDLVGNPFERARRLHLPFPLPRPSHLVPIPHFRPLRFVIGEAIPVTDRPAGGERDDEYLVRRLRREVEGAIHEIFEDELARRAHFAT
jgi:1-acyl-sn-glycerol-3-phosphate acyltransferase